MLTANPTTRSLSEAILDSGIQNTNYFNGRILNAGDLQTDQTANRQQHEQLGLASGAGVVQGLWVELVSPGSGTTAPVVSVSQGLALNANGQAVALPVNVQVALTRVTTPLPVDAGLFANCVPPSSTTVPLQAGIYILVAAPASGYSGQAPMYSFGDVNAATGCGSRYAVEGILFSLVPLDITKLTRLSPATITAITDPTVGLMAQTDPASLSKLRNWLAHICFGTEEVAGFVTDPFARTNNQSPYLTYGAIDALVASGNLTACDVPLGLLYWTNRGLLFLDRWSVRRRLVPPALTTTWPLPFSRRRRAEAEAVFLQFEEQIQTLFGPTTSDANLAALQASRYFRYLPAAAPIPTNGSGARGFALQQFLNGVTYRQPFFIEGAKLHSILNRSLAYAPVDLTSGELIWTYLLRQNIQAIDNATGIKPQQYLVLSTAFMPFEGAARFDLNHWSYANFS
jgi:hypothetical protein